MLSKHEQQRYPRRLDLCQNSEGRSRGWPLKSGIVSWRWVLSMAAVAGVMTVLLRAGAGDANGTWDVQLAQAIWSTRSPWGTSMMKVVSALTVPLLVISMLGLIAAHWLRRELRQVQALLAAALGLAAWVLLIKACIGRSRPVVEVLESVSGFSFPSAQVAAVTLLAAWSIHSANARLTTRRTRIAVGVLAFAAVVLVAYNRVYLGAHYPCDAIGAAMLGTFWTHVCIRFSSGDLQCTPERSAASCRKLTQR